MRFLNETFEHSDGTIGYPTLSLPAGTEYLLAWVHQSLDTPLEIAIYGNPAGLRHLAEMLIKVADYDQSTAAFPNEDSFHAHVSTGLNSEKKGCLPTLTIGRVDEKHDSSKLRDAFPPRVPEFSDKAISDMHL